MSIRGSMSPHDLIVACLVCLGLPCVILYVLESIGRAVDAAKTVSVNAEADAHYEEGQTAAANGIPCEACPYFPSHYDPDYTLLREQWLKGWINKTIELKKGTK